MHNRLFNRFNHWAHSEAFINILVCAAAFYIFVAVGVMVAA